MGGFLSRRFARRLISTDDGVQENIDNGWPVGPCRRFGRRRVDCAVRGPYGCEEISSIRLDSGGLLWKRGYICPDRGLFRRRPQGLSEPEPLPLL